MTQVYAPADKRFRRAHVKPGRKRRWRVILRHAVLIAVLLVALTWVAYRATEAVAQAKMLQIDQIVVTGNDRVPSATLLEVLDGLKGQNVIWTDLDDWRDRLLQSPWVRDAALRRSLPSTIEVAVSERLPAFIARSEGRLFLVDERGVVIDQHGPRHANFDLPIVDGLPLPRSTPGTQADPARAALAARVVASLRERPWLAARVSQIDVTDPHNAHVTLSGDAAVLHLGEEQFDARLTSYVQLADTLRLTVPDIEYVDLRFDGRVFVGPISKARRTPVAERQARPVHR